MTVKLRDLDAVLATLKDFQRDTVEYAFRRMYLDDPPARRFLIADEVGLGKTLVARGLIAKALHHLKREVERVDVVYVCSNGAIARQNINRLSVTEAEHTAIASRLTLLPAVVERLKSNRFNFISFTPGTTFDLKSKSGRVDERLVIYRILADAFPELERGLLGLLQGNVYWDRWVARARNYDQPLDPDLAAGLARRIRADRRFRRDFEDACDYFSDRRLRDDKDRRNTITGKLRRMLAEVCVEALEPDLIILDEFQRFRDLLDGQSEAAQLARTLMEFQDARVLLLSATPYRMLTLNHETDEDHYADFMRTLDFLFGDDDALAAVEEDLRRFRRGLHALGATARDDLARARDSLQARLRSVMVRTERVVSTAERDAMVRELRKHASVRPVDLRHAEVVDGVARAVGAGDAIEYWKSAPYLLNFMKDYELKRKLESAGKAASDDLLERLRDARPHLLQRRDIERYRAIDPANARLRTLLADTVDAGLWRLLWLPPSLPYYRSGGAYAEHTAATKSLVFSSWNVVPDAIAAICSFEAERRMLGDDAAEVEYGKLHTARRGLLRFTESEGRLTGMPALALMYPCVTLATEVDPLALGVEARSEEPSLDEVRERAAAIVEERLRGTGRWPGGARTGPADQRWYWAALALLDGTYHAGVREWSTAGDGWVATGTKEEGEPAAGFRRHVERFAEFFDGGDLGTPPDDLVQVLADVALGSPAVAGLRALRRLAPEVSPTYWPLLTGAARIAAGFRTLFNMPETMALLRADDEDAYWRLVLQHAAEGNLQAVLDEYVHVLRETLGLKDHAAADLVDGVSEAVADALSFRTSRVEADLVRAGKKRVRIGNGSIRIRCRFALRYGQIKDDGGKTVVRASQVQGAFNSPFRPFILATTSIGQEGLDFHPYCHAVYHWNLPSNPVDMEQREGRVHRYKGHAVRKNIARRYGLAWLRDHWRGQGDPWDLLFTAASADRPRHANELTPFWIYEVDGGAKVERRVPMIPFSREQGQLRRLKRSLAVYRLVFGQPRQQDLLEHLERLVGGDGWGEEVERWRIDLGPPNGKVGLDDRVGERTGSVSEW